MPEYEAEIRAAIEAVKDLPEGAFWAYLTVERGFDIEEVVEVMESVEDEQGEEPTP